MDKFRVETIVATPNPQQLVWAAMHQDYSEGFVWDQKDKFPDEAKAGELIVKHLLAGNRGHYGCYTADTEVLTQKGWKTWDKVSSKDRLLAVDIKTKQSRFEKPQAIQKIKFKPQDKLYTLHSPYLDLKVTLDHRMVVSHRQKSGVFSEWYFKPASEIYQQPVRYLLNSYLSSQERSFPTDIPLDFDLLTVFKIAGFFFGDGLRSYNQKPGVIRFRLKRPRKIAYLLSLGFPISQIEGDRYVIRNKPLAAWIHQHFSTEKGKRIPQWILTLPENAIAAFWDGLKNSDGTRVTKTSWVFDSCEKSALDLLQATAHINGFSANLTLNNPNEEEKHQNHRPCWRLNISERSTRRSESCQKNRTPGITESLSDYDGYVYCASVSTGALLVRRNGKVVVCGNCIEHPQITFNVGYFPHSMMQQIRTHRVGISFDVQCLAGDTEVTFVDCNNHSSPKLKKTMEELYDLWTNGEQASRERKVAGRNGELPGKYRRDCKKRLHKMNLRVLNEDTGLFEIGHIQDVIYSGIKPVYRLTLANGKTIDSTLKHRYLTSEGWQRLEDALGLIVDKNHHVIAITKNCKVMCNGKIANGIVRSDALYTQKNWLSYYAKQGLTANEIAKKCSCTPNTIVNWAKHYQIELKSGYRQGLKSLAGNGLYRNKIWLQRQLEEGLYVDEIARLSDCSIESVKKWVYKHGLSLNKKKSGSETPWNKNKGGYCLNLSEESQALRIKNANKFTKRGKESNFWKGGVSSERTLIGAWTRDIAPQVHQKFNYICQSCGVRGGNLHAHHLVPVFADVTLAYDFSNLISLCQNCHQTIHNQNLEAEFAIQYQPITEVNSWQNKPITKGNLLKAHAVNVVNIEFIGLQKTYDLEVAGRWHNFVANGMVVHNSFRYTGSRIIDVAEGKKDVEDVFYLRPVDNYTNRQGKRYLYSEEQRQKDLEWCLEACKLYQQRINEGLSEEHARSLIPFDARQNFVMSCNARSLMHLLDLRWKKDAQLEAQKLCELLYVRFEEWMPALARWYLENRAKKARLSP